MKTRVLVCRMSALILVVTLVVIGMPLPVGASTDESVVEASAGRVLTLNGHRLWEVLHSPGRGAALAPLAARRPQEHRPPATQPVSLSGPRFGVTFLSDDILKKLREDYEIDVTPVVSQFGWQFERRFTTGENGPTVLNEWVVLVGGLDQGVVIPSLTWLVGIRTGDGTEFGFGPNLTPAGVALAVSWGMTFRTGDLNVPVNVAVVPSRSGVRVSVLTGWNIRR